MPNRMRSVLDNIDIIICFFRALMCVYARFSCRKVFLRIPLPPPAKLVPAIAGCRVESRLQRRTAPCAHARPRQRAEHRFKEFSLTCPSQPAVPMAIFDLRFLRRGSPLTRCLQAISDTKEEYRILPDNEPADYFATPLRVKKFTPAWPGHAEEISLKMIVRTLAPVQLSLQPSSPRMPAAVSIAKSTIPIRYQKGSEGNV